MAGDLFQKREQRRVETPSAVSERENASLVFHDLRPDIFSGSGVRGVHVCDEAQRGNLFHAGGGRQFAENIGMFGDRHIFDARLPHFLR